MKVAQEGKGCCALYIEVLPGMHETPAGALSLPSCLVSSGCACGPTQNVGRLPVHGRETTISSLGW